MLFRIIRKPTPTFLQDYVRRIALISATDQPTFEQVLSSSIRRVSSGDNEELQLKTLGKPTAVTLDIQEQTKRILSIKLALEMKVELDLCERQFFGVLKYIRKAFGKPSIEVGPKSALRRHKSMFADLFTIRRVELETFGGVKGENFIVYCLDVSVFVHRIAMRRGMTSDHLGVKFDVDYGSLS